MGRVSKIDWCDATWNEKEFEAPCAVKEKSEAQRIAELEDQVYNLTLYLREMEDFCPDRFELLRDAFSGMPGYEPTPLNR